MLPSNFQSSFAFPSVPILLSLLSTVQQSLGEPIVRTLTIETSPNQTIFSYNSIVNVTFTIEPRCEIDELKIYKLVQRSSNNNNDDNGNTLGEEEPVECIFGINCLPSSNYFNFETLTTFDDSNSVATNQTTNLTAFNVNPFKFIGSYYAECVGTQRPQTTNHVDFHVKSNNSKMFSLPPFLFSS